MTHQPILSFGDHLMSKRSFLLALAAVVGAAMPARAARAQSAATTSDAAAAIIATSTMTAVRAIATYDVTIRLRDARIASRLTVADSAGTLVGTAMIAGDATPVPMLVVVQGTDLVLSADTPRGLLEFVFHGANDWGAGRRVSGQWIFGEEHGTLVGKIRS